MTRISTIDAGARQQVGGAVVQRGGRRGVLLLIVLSMLTLFMMLGAAYLAAATRARTAAKAYAKLTFGADDARIPVAPLLDDVLLRVVRGPAPAGISGDFESLLEDKYGDTSTTLSGTANVTTASNSPVLTGTLTLTSGTLRPSDLVGRVLTLAGQSHVATSHRIVRASNVGSPSNTPQTAVPLRFRITLDKPFRSDQAVPATGDVRAIVNGREFSGDPNPSSSARNEPWDGFDDKNLFLARVAGGPTVARSAAVQRPSYRTTAQVDNDGDGEPDGRQFQDWDLPPFTDAAGNTVNVTASVLVVDLDGRFNVNAHGSLAPTLYPDNHTGWTTAAGVGDPPNRTRLDAAPLGSGYGPADIQFNIATGTMATGTSGNPNPKLFDPPSSRQLGENPRLSIVVGDDGIRQKGIRPPKSRFGEASNAITPRAGLLLGKYGGNAAADSHITPALRIGADLTFALPRPGQPNANDNTSYINDRRALVPPPGDAVKEKINRGVPPVWWNTSGTFNWYDVPDTDNEPSPRGVYNSPPDLHGRMKTLTLPATGWSVVPQLVFVKPEWDDSSGKLGAETKDDPYELLLDTRRGLGGWLRDPASSTQLRHNSFSLAELEAVLRPYDIDTNRKPQRLATMLGTDAEASRLRFTTESWDTTTITGSAARQIYGNGDPASPTGWLQTIPAANTTALSGTSPVTGLLSGEVARGEKFDLNRAFDPPEPLNDAGYQPSRPYFVQRQAYFKDFYTLLVALQSGTGALPTGTNPGNAQALAQWAANVVKFRDADSRIIPFEYEQDIKLNGWTVDSDVGGSTSDPSLTTTRRVVWPAVRPEIVIREVVAWHNNDPAVTGAGKSGLVISLHRPWNAKAYASGTANLIHAEPCDYALDTLVDGSGNPQATGRPSNEVDLGKKADASVLGPNVAKFSTADDRTHYPIWRLRMEFGGQTRFMRFDINDAVAGADEIALPDVTNGASRPRMGPDSTLTFYSGEQVTVGPALTATTASINVTTLNGQPLPRAGRNALPAPRLQTVVTASGTGRVYLERLSDPSVTLIETDPLPTGQLVSSGDPPTGKQIWEGKDTVLGKPDETQVPVRYIVVDVMDFDATDTSVAVPPAIPPLSASRRSTTGPSAFWLAADPDNQTTPVPAPRVPVPLTPPPEVPGQLPPGDTAWFVWPNRPFISAAELLLVPQGDCLTMLQKYVKAQPDDWNTIGLPLPEKNDAGDLVRPLLFDAVYVPTRFSGIHTTSTDTHSPDTSIFSNTTPVNQFSAYREPGRVNLNTITSEEVWNAVIAGPLNAPIVDGSTAGLGIASSSNKTIKTMLEAIGLESGGTDVPEDTDPALAVAHNPTHAIYTATRLANTVTTRSNVFAVWITLKEEVAGDPDSVRYHRGFYIVDRSIPVGFEQGKDHNVWDCVRLRRVIE